MSHYEPKRKTKIWHCTRCAHSWIDKHVPTYSDYRGHYIDSFSGDTLFTPPKESCPQCGSKYNLRSMDNTVVDRDTENSTPNINPWTGEVLAIRLERRRRKDERAKTRNGTHPG